MQISNELNNENTEDVLNRHSAGTAWLRWVSASE